MHRVYCPGGRSVCDAIQHMVTATDRVCSVSVVDAACITARAGCAGLHAGPAQATADPLPLPGPPDAGPAQNPCQSAQPHGAHWEVAASVQRLCLNSSIRAEKLLPTWQSAACLCSMRSCCTYCYCIKWPASQTACMQGHACDNVVWLPDSTTCDYVSGAPPGRQHAEGAGTGRPGTACRRPPNAEHVWLHVRNRE